MVSAALSTPRQFPLDYVLHMMYRIRGPGGVEAESGTRFLDRAQDSHLPKKPPHPPPFGSVVHASNDLYPRQLGDRGAI